MTLLNRNQKSCIEFAPDAQAIFFCRRHQPRRPPLAKMRPSDACCSERAVDPGPCQPALSGRNSPIVNRSGAMSARASGVGGSRNAGRPTSLRLMLCNAMPRARSNHRFFPGRPPDRAAERTIRLGQPKLHQRGPAQPFEIDSKTLILSSEPDHGQRESHKEDWQS